MIKEEYKKKNAATAAYLAGVAEKAVCFSAEGTDIWNKLKNNREANIIRKLSILRATLYLNYTGVNNFLRSHTQVQLLDAAEDFNADDVDYLCREGINLHLFNATADDYAIRLNEEITNHVDAVEDLFDDFINFKYIRRMLSASTVKPKDIKKEIQKYQTNRQSYPFQAYICCTKTPNSFMFYDDKSFCIKLYADNGNEFQALNMCLKCESEELTSFEKFFKERKKVVVVVDCENASFDGVLSFVTQNDNSRVAELLLIDDAQNTTDAWRYLQKLIDVPVHRIAPSRVLGAKSLVDVRLAVEVTRRFYENKADGFVLCASDSDYCTLIEALPEDTFMVLYEADRMSSTYTQLLDSMNVKYYNINAISDGDPAAVRRKLAKEMFIAKLSKAVEDLAIKEWHEICASLNCEDDKELYSELMDNLRVVIDREE